MMPFLTKLRSKRFGRPVHMGVLVNSYRLIQQPVLADLAEFCGAIDQAPVTDNMFEQGRVAGRRDVWLRIMAHRSLREEEVYALLKGDPIATAVEQYNA